MIFGYARVSTMLQNTDRQIEELLKFGVKKENLYIDKTSGKNFDRDNYKKLMKKIKKRDLLVVKSLDRLGRNYEMIIDEWKKITSEKGVDILILDMPILDTRDKGDSLLGKFITDIVLQILSFVAETERINISQRTKEGLNIARLKGKKLGRPAIVLPNESKNIFNLYLNKKISCTKACDILQISKGTFYKLLYHSHKNEGGVMNT